MSSKSLGDKGKRETADATDLRPKPADFPLGSLLSRAAARRMHEELKRNQDENAEAAQG